MTLADEMKAMELSLNLPPKMYYMIRVDGRSFHTFTKGMRRPFDHNLVEAMNLVSRALCAEIQGAQFAYTQSDEISVLVTDFGEKAEMWFGGDHSKWVSISAGVASACMGMQYPGQNPVFDSRVTLLRNQREVCSYLMWRQRDCHRNAIRMIGSCHYSHKQLDGVGTWELMDKLHTEKGLDAPRVYRSYLYGRMTVQQATEEEITYTRKDTGETRSEMVTRNRWDTRPLDGTLSYERWMPYVPERRGNGDPVNVGSEPVIPVMPEVPDTPAGARTEHGHGRAAHPGT